MAFFYQLFGLAVRLFHAVNNLPQLFRQFQVSRCDWESVENCSPQLYISILYVFMRVLLQAVTLEEIIEQYIYWHTVRHCEPV